MDKASKWDTVIRLLRYTRLWIIALPLALTFVGAAMNQAVVVSNHDRFPVMLNSRQLAAHAPDADGLIDEIHCVMSASTRLNWLADFIDLRDATYSPGDLILMLGEWFTPFAPFIWGAFLLTDKLRND